jgi:hypothetical protein
MGSTSLGPPTGIRRIGCAGSSLFRGFERQYTPKTQPIYREKAVTKTIFFLTTVIHQI